MGNTVVGETILWYLQVNLIMTALLAIGWVGYVVWRWWVSPVVTATTNGFESFNRVTDFTQEDLAQINYSEFNIDEHVAEEKKIRKPKKKQTNTSVGAKQKRVVDKSKKEKK